MKSQGSVSPLLVVLLLLAMAAASYFLMFAPGPASEPVADPGASAVDPRPGPEEQPPGPAPLVSGEGRGAARDPGPARPPQKVEPDHLQGSVRDIHGNPLPGATVQIFTYEYDTNPQSTARLLERAKEVVLRTTAADEQGDYVFSRLVPSAQYYIRAFAPEYVTQIKDNLASGIEVNFTLRRGARVEGHVISAATKEPVVNALVRAFYKTPDGISDVNRLYRWTEHVRTDDKGAFVLEGAPAEAVQFLIYHDAHPDHSETRPVEAGKVNRFRFDLRAGIALECLLLDKMTEEPVPNALIRVRAGMLHSSSSRTGADGRFTLRGLNPGPQFFDITAHGYTMTTLPQDIAQGDAFDPQKNNIRVLRIEPAGFASGVVRDPDGRPVPNARVYVAAQNILITSVRGRPEATTDAEGRFLIQNLDSGRNYVLAAYRDGFGIGVSEPIAVGPLEVREGTDIRMSRGATIYGAVLSEDKTPVAGAHITVQVPVFGDVWFPPGLGIGEASTKVVVTGDDGRYSLEGLWRGEYKFDVSHEAHVHMETKSVRVSDIEETVSRDFMLQLGRSIAGIVTDASGLPGEGATVTAARPWSSRAEAEAKVDAEGRFEIKGLTRGNYRVQARKEGFSSEPAEDVAADTANLHLRLIENGSIMGNVVGFGGRTVETYSVNLLPAFDDTPESLERSIRRAPPMQSYSDPSGAFIMEGLDPGFYTVTIRAVGYAESLHHNVQVPSGSVANLGTVTLDRGAEMKGSITDTAGVPVRDAMVRITRKVEVSNPNLARAMSKLGGSGGSGDDAKEVAEGALPQVLWQAYPGADGTYSITGITPGVFTVEIRPGRHVIPEPFEVTIRRNEEVVRDFQLALASTIGLVVADELGDPVTAAGTRVIDVNTQKPPPGFRPGTTDARGVATVGNLPPGSYRVILTRAGYIVHEEVIAVGPGESVRREVVLQKIR